MAVLDENAFGLIPKFMSMGLKAAFEPISSKEHAVLFSKTLREKETEVYIHFPFCRSICRLCPYFRIVMREDLFRAYWKALLREIEEHRKLCDFEVMEAYFGGGTPSLAPAEFFLDVISALGEPKSVGIEANPNDLLDETYASSLRKAGITQLSIGVQSFSEKVLKALGRKHGPEDGKKAVRIARLVGFDNINIDLMFLAPGESFEDWKHTLEEAVSLDPDQITAYPTLIAEHVKPRAKGLSQNVSLFEEYIRYTDEFLREHGYKRIRIESWTRKGNYSTVNLEMEGPLIAFGAGAIGFTGGYEYVNVLNVHEYVRRVSSTSFGVSHGRVVKDKERFIRVVMDQLFYFGRLEEEYLKRKLGKTFKDFPLWLKSLILWLRILGYLRKEDGVLRATDKAFTLMHKITWAFVLKIPCRIVMKGIIYQNEKFVVP